MDKLNLNNITLTKLKKITNSGGDILRVIKNNDKGFTNFGEAYFSWIKYNAIKAWKIHNRMTLNLIVPIGKVKFVFFLPNNKKKIRVIEIGESNNNYKRITVPPKVCFGFKGLAKRKSLVLNIANIRHIKSESKKYELDYHDYQW